MPPYEIRTSSEQPQKCRCKGCVYWCYLTSRGSLEAVPRQRCPGGNPSGNISTTELSPCQMAAKPAPFLCVRDSHRCVCHSALILPTAGQESPACLIRCLVSLITGLMLSEHRCSTCQTHKIKKQLISYMWGFAPLLQVTWVCLQCSSSIFSYFPTSVRKRGI